MPKVDLKNKKILLVDDISGTGNTLKNISNLIVEKYKVQELKTSTIAIIKGSLFLPDFYAFEESGDWRQTVTSTQDRSRLEGYRNRAGG